jgi:pyruvate dehydrogenase E1 component beta subunit
MANQALTIVGALNLALKQEMARDKSVMVYGEDVGVEGGVFRVTEGLQKIYGKDRCFDSPLSEAGIIGTAIGLAINGMKPVVEMQFDGFVMEGLPQILDHAARMRNRSRGAFTVPMVVRFPYGGGIKALEHHSEAMESVFGHIPGLKVVIPSTPFDAKGLLISAIRDPDPVIFLEPKRLYRAFKQEVPEEEYFIPIGKAALIQDGTDVTLLAYGAMVRECQKAAIEAHKMGISCMVVDLRSISPLDRDAILFSAEKTGRVVIVHEASRTFGAAGEISMLIYEHLYGKLKAPIERVTGFDIAMPLLRGEDLYLVDSFRVLEGIKKVMGKA